VILGVSHLAVGSRDLNRDRQRLESQGWRTEFLDDDVCVHPFERPFLSSEHPGSQSLALLRHPAGLPALELVAPVLTSPAQRTNLDFNEIAKGACHGTIKVQNPAETTSLFVDALGFGRRDESTSDRAVLSLRRPLSQWSMNLTIQTDSPATELPMLDSEGWFVLALFSSDVPGDARRVQEHNVKAVTQPFITEVNGQRWTIVLCVLNSGFAVELLQPHRIG
jgi:hypothetical protein